MGADDQPSDLELDTIDAGPPLPAMPAGFGVIKPHVPAPDPEQLTRHALAGYEVVAIHAEPKASSAKLGYLRYGARTKVTVKVPDVDDPDCPKGWHQLPYGGFACASKGLVVEARPPYMHNPPPPPRLDETFPYDYAYVRKWNSPMFWKIPSEGELARAYVEQAVREAERQGLPPPGTEPAKAPTGGERRPAPAPAPSDAPSAAPPGLDELPKPADADPPSDAAPAKPDAPGEPAAADEPAKPDAPGEPAADDEPAEPEPPPPPLPLNPSNPWLERGFFLSLAEKMTDAGKTWWRTSRGGYVPGDAAYLYEAKDFHGQALGDDITFPVGFVMGKSATVYELDEGDALKRVATYEPRTFVDVDAEVELKGKTYLRLQDGRLIAKDKVRLAELQPLPEGLATWERWIDVSLSKQMLVAYEGERPAYVTLVSTGKKGPAEEPFETPTGRWRIRSKHVSTTMDGSSAADGNYSIMDVPWTMFFEGSYALHGAFWHASFGYVRSHGCVNLGPSDARWLFYWTTPFLPEGWHGVHAQSDAPGTTVIVRP
jgi:hypothetical protein